MTLVTKRHAVGAAVGAAAVALTLASAHPAAAQGNFATFTQENTSSSPFTFTNNGSSSTMTGSADVVWNWLVPTSVTTTSAPIDATMTFSAVVTSTATASASGIPLIRQSLDITDLLFTDNANGKTLLNLITPEAASMVGQKNQATGSVTANTASYTSDFLAFNPPQDGTMTIALAAISPHLTVSGNQYLTGFHSSGTGTFAYATRPVPELGTVISLATMVLGGVAGVKRPRRRALKA